jgi:ABC-type amino acid transport substrate-binding protein
MNRRLFFGVLLAALLVGSVPGAIAQDAGEGVFSRIQRRGELRVGMLGISQFPYVFWRDGTLAGLEADLAADIASRLDVRLAVDASFGSRQEMLNALNQGRVDVALSKYKRNLEDGLRARFSAPYSRIDYVLLVNRKAFASLKKTGAAEDVLRGHAAVIGIIGDDIYRRHLATSFPLAEVAPYPSRGRLYDGLLQGDCIAAFVDEAEARQLLADRPELGLSLQYVALPFISDAVCMATSWRSSFLADWLDILVASRGEPVALEELFQTYSDGVPHGK